MKLSAVVDGAQRIFEVPARNLKDLDGPLRAAGKKLRAAAAATFEQGRARSGGAWPPTATSTTTRLQQTTVGPVSIAGRIRPAYLAQARRGLQRAVRAGRATYLARDEFERLAHGGSAKLSLEADVPKKLRSAAVRRLRAGLNAKAAKRRRGRRKAAKHKLLGKLPSGLRLAVRKGLVVVEHIVAWAGAHNEGATVGHGARLPARTFLELVEQDITDLVTAIYEHVFSEYVSAEGEE